MYGGIYRKLHYVSSVQDVLDNYSVSIAKRCRDNDRSVSFQI